MPQRLCFLNTLQPFFISVTSMVCAYFESTALFMTALLLSFIFNILAGFRADEVRFKMWRLCNFEGDKFKDSLIEFTLIVVCTYFLKLLVELMNHQDKGSYVVECLVWVALYSYVRNGFRNLSTAYPKIRWLRFVNNVISFKFSELAPDFIKKSWDESKNKNDEK